MLHTDNINKTPLPATEREDSPIVEPAITASVADAGEKEEASPALHDDTLQAEQQSDCPQAEDKPSAEDNIRQLMEDVVSGEEYSCQSKTTDDIKASAEDNIRQLIEDIESGEEYSYLSKTMDDINATVRAYEELGAAIQKANIEYEATKTDIAKIITESQFFEKNFDTICLFRSPEQSVEARDWFDSLKNALLLMEKASKGETDEKLGRVPPSSFRACIKLSSRFEPVYTISTSTPIFRLKPTACSAALAPFAIKVANSLSQHSRYLLSTDQGLKAELLKVIPASQTYKDIASARDAIEKSEIEEFNTRLENCCLIDDDTLDEELEQLHSDITTFQNSLGEKNKSLYETSCSIAKTVSALRKSFYENSLKDYYKLFNDVDRLLRTFTSLDHSNIEDGEKENWKNLLLNLRNRVLKYLNCLSIYENETVVEEVTVWNDSMDFIHILEAEADDSKQAGLISKINSIGFYYMNSNGEKTQIEKTKVFVYKKSK